MAASSGLLARKALRFMAIEFSYLKAYSVDFFAGLGSFAAYLLVTFFLWGAVYANANITVMPFAVLLSYYVFAFITGDVTGNRAVAHGLGDDIKNGDLTGILLRPTSYFAVHLFMRLFHFIFSLTVFSATAFVASFFIPVVFQSDPLHIALFLLTLFLGFILNFCIFFALGCVAFWTESNYGIIRSFSYFSHFMSGQLLPLAFFGGALATAASLLPIRFFVDFPVSIILGRITLDEATGGIVLEIAWIAALFLLGQFLWRKGLRHYGAPGV